MDTISKEIVYVCPVHGEHEAVMFVSAKTPNEGHAEHIAFCMFCLQEKLEAIGVHRMQIKSK